MKRTPIKKENRDEGRAFPARGLRKLEKGNLPIRRDSRETADDVRSFIATKTKSNVRDWRRVGQVGGLLFAHLDADQFADGATGSAAHRSRAGRKITIDAILKAVAERFQIKPSQTQREEQHAKGGAAAPGGPCTW